MATFGGFNVQDTAFAGGAKGDGMNNDGPAIAACYGAALAAAPVGSAQFATKLTTVYWPPGVYLIDRPIPQYATVRTVEFGAMVAPYESYTGDCFQIMSNPGVMRYGRVGVNQLPSIAGSGADLTGAGFANGIHYMPGTVQHKAAIGSIEGCGTAVYAEYTDFNHGPVLGHTLDFNYITACTYGFKLHGDSTNGAAACQGLLMRGNFMYSVKYPIFFTDTSSASNPNVVNNHFDIRSIDGASLAGAQAITFDTGNFTGGLNTFLIPNFLSFFPNGYIRKQNGGSAQGNDYTITQVGNALNSHFDGLTATGTAANVCRVTGTAIYQGLAANATPTATTPFDPLNAVVSNRYELTLTLPTALTSGQYADFYCYSPLTTGVRGQPNCWTETAVTYPLVVTICEDESLFSGADGAAPSANRVHIRVAAFGSVAAGTAMNVIVQCGM
jgi:hypothetical protein